MTAELFIYCLKKEGIKRSQKLRIYYSDFLSSVLSFDWQELQEEHIL